MKDDIFFTTPILKSLAVPVIWLALIDAIYSRIAPFFALNCIFFPANEGATLWTKQPIRFQGLFKVTDQIAGKWETKSIMWQILQLLLTKVLLFPPQKWMNLISDRLSTTSIKYLTWPSPLFGWFENGCNKVVTEPRVVQFWSEIILVISAQIALHSIQLQLWIKVWKWNFFMEIVSLLTSLPQQLSHSYSSVFKVFFSFFCSCFFLVSYTPNFKTYEFLPISFLSRLNAYFYAFFFSFFQRFLPSSHGVTGVPPLVWHFTLMACKIFDSAVVVNTNTDLVMSWVVEMVISSLLLLRELHPVTGKLSIVDVYMHRLLSGSDSVFYY